MLRFQFHEHTTLHIHVDDCVPVGQIHGGQWEHSRYVLLGDFPPHSRPLVSTHDTALISVHVLLLCSFKVTMETFHTLDEKCVSGDTVDSVMVFCPRGFQGAHRFIPVLLL